MTRVVVTLLVRDEEDVIDDVIRFHLAQGAAFVIVTDNGSVDRTPAIVDEWVRLGRARLLHEPGDDYDQRRWVTAMARLAATDYGADWVLNADADELWWPLAADLPSTLDAVPAAFGQIACPRVDFPPTRPRGALATGSAFREAVAREVSSRNALGAPLPPKVVHRADPEVEVEQGNHAVRGPRIGPMLPGPSPITILHHPVRSWEQFERKIVAGGRAYERNTQVGADVGATWRSLYAEWEAGTLTDRYDELVLGDDAARAGVRAGRLVVDHRVRTFLAAGAPTRPSARVAPAPGARTAPAAPVDTGDPARFAPVTAVVVTWEAPEVAVACLRGIAAQTVRPRRTVVIDNGRRQPAADAIAAAGLADGTVEVVRPGANLGPAGGFARGLELFADGADDHAWLMDDDVVPAAGCLEAMLAMAARSPRAPVLVPELVHGHDRKRPGGPRWCGVLLPRAAVAAGGRPREDLFFWAEDTEYLQRRLPAAGHPLKTVPGAEVHDSQVRRIGPAPAWRYYYEARNGTWYRIRAQRGRKLHKLPVQLARLSGRIIARDGVHRLGKLRLVAVGVAHGARGRLGRTLEP